MPLIWRLLALTSAGLAIAAAVVILRLGGRGGERGGGAASFSEIVGTLYRQCARWAVAAEQDRSEVIAVLHANYAAGYLWAIKDIATTDEFKRVTGADWLTFERKIVAIQDAAARRLVGRCSAVVPIADADLTAAMYYRAPAEAA